MSLRPGQRCASAPRHSRSEKWLLVLLPAVLAALSSPAWGAEWRVPSSAAPTLAAALAAASDGDTVLLAPGVYRERVVIDKSVILRPDGRADAVVLDGGGQGSVLTLAAPNTVIEGLTLQASGDDLGKSDACLYVRKSAGGANILGNVFRDCAFGIWVNGTADIRIENNEISGRPRPIFSDRGNGINLWEVRRGVIRGNRIRGTRDGIYLSVTSDSRVENNRMRDLRFGVHYMYSDNNRVTGNITHNSLVGLALMFSKRLAILDNRAIGNRDQGIVFRSIYDSEIRGNRVTNNGKGLFLNDTSFNRIEGNHVQDNAIGLQVTGGSEDNIVVGNTFLRNRTQVQYTWRRSLFWDGQGKDAAPGPGGNHWSDYLGWDFDGDGLGDRPHYTASTMDHLIHRYPVLKVLATSPVVLLLQALESRFPVLRPAGVIDRHPLLAPPTGTKPTRAEHTGAKQASTSREGRA